MGYKITYLQVQKLRNVLEAQFDTEFNNNVVKISGENGAGKSTIIDAIFLAIVGRTYIGRGREIENLITDGQDRATIEVTLENSQRKLTITRKITDKGTVTLDVIASDGSKLLQKDLDELLSEFTIDPIEFMKKSKKEQYEIVKSLAGVDTGDIDYQIQIQEKKTQDQRAVTTAKRGALQDFGIKPKVERVSSEDIMNEYKGHSDFIRNYEEQEKEINSKKDTVSLLEKQVVSIDEQIKKLQEEKTAKENGIIELNNQIIQMSETHGNDEPVYQSSKLALEELKDASTKVDTQNKQALEYEKSVQLLKERDEADKKLKEEEETLEKLRNDRKLMIEGGNLPIEGLSFNETEGVMVEGRPIDQFSSAQQIILACRIATVGNPNMKLIHIKDGSLLDKNSMILLQEIAEKNDYQVIIERVGEEFDGIVMRDGSKIHP